MKEFHQADIYQKLTLIFEEFILKNLKIHQKNFQSQDF